MDRVKKGCEPCVEYKDLELPEHHPHPRTKHPCPHTVEELCHEVNEQFKLWHDWGDNVNDTLRRMLGFIWRLEHAVCCLEGYVVYGKGRPQEGLICDSDGKFEKGTLHELVGGTWPLTDPPDDPWGTS